MKAIVRYRLTLAIICIAAGGILATVNYLTQPRITVQAQEQQESALAELLPAAVSFTPIKSGDEVLYYKGYDKDKNFAGVVFEASAKGYSGIIKTMAGLTRDGNITAIKIISQNETPGLGARIAEPDFTRRFSAKNIAELSQVQAITGATVSSMAVINSVAKRAKDLQEWLKNEK